MNHSNTKSETIRVKLIYRNYKNIHPIYHSLIDTPPKGIKYIFPKTKSKLRKLHLTYRKYRHLKIVKIFADAFDKYVFIGSNEEPADILHFISVVHPNPEKIKENYIVEFEHVMALTKMNHNPQQYNKVVEFLSNTKCKGIVCLSQAAKNSLKRFLKNSDYECIKSKIEVIYPASKIFEINNSDNEIIKRNDNSVNLLFVGNDVNRKGLHELLLAIKELPKKVNKKIKLYIVSNDADYLVSLYNLENVYLYPANYNREEVINKFFAQADIFVFPTKHDTFGMVIVDSLAAGTPVISTKQFAIPEMVKDGVNGILIEMERSLLDDVVAPTNDQRKENEDPSNIDKKIVKELSKTIGRLAKNKKIIYEMSKHASDELTNFGKLSINQRNKMLKELYERSLN